MKPAQSIIFVTCLAWIFGVAFSQFTLETVSFDANSGSNGGEFTLVSKTQSLAATELKGGDFTIQGIAPIQEIPTGIKPHPRQSSTKLFLKNFAFRPRFELLPDQREVLVLSIHGKVIWKFSRSDIKGKIWVEVPENAEWIGLQIVRIR